MALEAGRRCFNPFSESFNRRKEKNKYWDCPLNLHKPSHELSLEETLTWTFDLYSKNFAPLFIPILVSALLTGLLGNIILFNFMNIPQIPARATPQEVWSLLFTYLTGVLPIVFAYGILSWIISTIAYGVCIKCASDLIEKGSASLEHAFNFMVNRLVPLLIGSIISGVLTALGLVAFIIPGLILSVMFFLVVPAIIIENLGAIEGLSRSRNLVSNRWLKTFGLILIIGIIISIVSFIASLIAAPFGSFRWLPSSIISAFVQPIFPIATTVYFYSMLARHQQGSPPQP